MSNPTLINGFEDVLTFLSQQGNLIKKLQEENNKLKEENKELKDLCDKQVKAYALAVSRYPEVKNEVEELKEEIKNLKEELEEANCSMPDCCVDCDKRFDLHSVMNDITCEEDECLRKKYDEYFGSDNDRGDLCKQCIREELP